MIYVEKNLSCGEIPDFYVRTMWRNLKFLHMWRIFQISSQYQCGNFTFLHIWHVCDVENGQFMLLCCTISVFCDIRCFVTKSVLSQFTHFCVENFLIKNCVCGENMTNMRYDLEAWNNFATRLGAWRVIKDNSKSLWISDWHCQMMNLRISTWLPLQRLGWSRCPPPATRKLYWGRNNPSLEISFSVVPH